MSDGARLEPAVAPAQAWDAHERATMSWQRELDRLKRRARTHWLRTLSLAVALATLATFKLARKPLLAPSRVVIRVTEGSILFEQSPLQFGDLGQYLSDTALSAKNLLSLIDRFDLYRSVRAHGDLAAVAEMRGYVQLDVFKNYFAFYRYSHHKVRSARIAITFRHPDPEISYAVTRALADLVIQSESERRRLYSEGRLAVASKVYDATTERIAELLDEERVALADLMVAQVSGDKAKAANLRYRIHGLGGEIKAQQEQVRQAQDERDELALQFGLNQRNIGMQFEVVDSRPPPVIEAPSLVQLLMQGLVCFVIVLPLCGIAVGAFDTRLHDREDVGRLGLPVVGHVPGFTGMTEGSLAARRKAARRGPASVT